jgi:hypothetical protein
VYLCTLKNILPYFLTMKYLSWQTDLKRFRAMTGYDPIEFNELLPYFEVAHTNYLRYRTMCGKIRNGQRSASIYANSPLPCIEERMAFILSYWKLNPLQEQHADLFSMTQKQCYEFVLRQAQQPYTCWALFCRRP